MVAGKAGEAASAGKVANAGEAAKVGEAASAGEAAKVGEDASTGEAASALNGPSARIFSWTGRPGEGSSRPWGPGPRTMWSSWDREGER